MKPRGKIVVVMRRIIRTWRGKIFFFCKGNVAQTSWETKRIGKNVAWIISSSIMMNVLAATIPVENRIVIPANKSETSWWSNCLLFFFKALLSSKIFSEGITPQPLHIWLTDIYIKLTINRWRKFHVSKQNPKIIHAHFHVKACETLIKFGDPNQIRCLLLLREHTCIT